MTSRRRHLLTLVHDAIALTGLAPSTGELAVATGTTHGAVVRHLQALERDGFLMRRRGEWRSAQITRLPGGGLLAAEIAWCHANPERVRALMTVVGARAAA